MYSVTENNLIILQLWRTRSIILFTLFFRRCLCKHYYVIQNEEVMCSDGRNNPHNQRTIRSNPTSPIDPVNHENPFISINTIMSITPSNPYRTTLSTGYPQTNYFGNYLRLNFYPGNFLPNYFFRYRGNQFPRHYPSNFNHFFGQNNPRWGF